MAKPKLRGVLLCEDLEHERFFRGLLEKKWFGRGKLKVEGKAGDAYVLASYARWVQFARSKRAENFALIVAIDGDAKGLEARLDQLAAKLADAGLPKREQSERVAVFVPTRSVETWELWLCGHREVDELADCKQSLHRTQKRGDASVKKAVTKWFQQRSPEEERAEQQRLPALAAGREETRRFDV